MLFQWCIFSQLFSKFLYLQFYRSILFSVLFYSTIYQNFLVRTFLLPLPFKIHNRIKPYSARLVWETLPTPQTIIYLIIATSSLIKNLMLSLRDYLFDVFWTFSVCCYLATLKTEWNCVYLLLSYIFILVLHYVLSLLHIKIFYFLLLTFLF